MSRIGKLPIPVPSGVDVSVDEPPGDGQGPQGHPVATPSPRPITVERGDDGVLEVKRPDDERESRSLHGLTRTLIANMVDRRDRGLREEARDRRRGLPRPVQGPDPAGVPARLLATRSRSTPPRASRSRSRARPSSASRASTSSWSARSPRTSASCASPSRTRARASATRASTSAARSERLVSDMAIALKHGKHTAVAPRRACVARSAVARRSPARRSVRASSSPGPRRHISAQVVDDLVGKTLASASHHGGRPARPRRRQDRQGQAASASSSPSVRRPPVSRAWSSTAPATSTTAASRPLPMAPARAASTF